LKLIVFPIGTAHFDYRYLRPVLPFACLGIRQANHHRIKLAGDSAGQPLSRVFERYSSGYRGVVSASGVWLEVRPGSGVVAPDNGP
jgi:hypothetical protein